MSLKYRPEIDGLRAIAVSAVVFYHADFFFYGIKPFGGGFLGVDIFFVISGYLITSIIFKKIIKGEFSLLAFYERRARRILPALFTVALSSIPFAWIYMYPKMLKEYASSVLSSLAFISNFWFWREDSYTAEPSALKPFLHTWSLSVEEQFYILFPIALILLWRYAKKYISIFFFASFLFSLALAQYGSAYHASAAFYLLPTRIWELLSGAILAKIEIDKGRSGAPLLHSIMPSIGVILICFPLVMFDDQIQHPSLFTVPIIFGTMAIIWFGKKGELISNILGSKLFVAVGLVSYSFYLWHFPIFAFTRIANKNPSQLDYILGIALSLFLSILAYFLVERPVRSFSIVNRKSLLIGIATSVTVIALINVYFVRTDGAIHRLEYAANIIKENQRIFVIKNGKRCHSQENQNHILNLKDSCIFEYAPGGQYIVSIGDSHAGSLSENLRIYAKKNGYNFIQLTQASCIHIQSKFEKKSHCKNRSDQIVPFLRQYPESIIVYSARLPVFIEKRLFDNKEGDKEKGFPPPHKLEPVIEKEKRQRAHDVTQTLNSWVKEGHSLMIVYPVPEQGFYISEKFFKQRPLIRSELDLPVLSTSYDVFNERVKSSYAALNLVSGKKVFRIYPEKIFCRIPEKRCIASEGSEVYFYGDNHVSPRGADLIINQISKQLR